MGSDTSKRNWKFIFSPYMIVAIIALGIYIFKPFEPKGEIFDSLAFVMFPPCVIIGLSIDFILRGLLLKSERKALYIWTVESILLAIVLIIFYLLGYFTTRLF